MVERVDLSCVGCGARIASAAPGETLAVSCRCGAVAPILHNKGHVWTLPASLIAGFQASIQDGHEPEIGHLEYYLGHSAHQSALKDQLTKDLKNAGSSSQRECRQDECRARYWGETMRQRFIRDGRLSVQLGAVADAMKALQDKVIEVEGGLPEGWPADPYVATKEVIRFLRAEEEPPPRVTSTPAWRSPAEEGAA